MSQLARLNTVKNLVMEHLLVSPTYGTYTANGNYSENYILDEIKKANDDIVFAICSNKVHSRRGDFVTTQLVTAITTSGTALPASIGGWTNIRISRTDSKQVLGKEQSFDWIDTLNEQNANLGLSPEDWQGYFNIVGDKLYFTGASAGVDYCDPAPASSALTAPAEMETAIRDLALCRFYMKHEDKPTSAQFYRDLAFGIIGAIRNDEKEIPSINR